MRMAAGDDEGEHGKSEIVISLLALLEKNGVDVTFKVIDGDERLVESKGKSLGVADADQQRAGESGTLRDRESIDGLVGSRGVGESFAHNGNDGLKVFARSELGNDSAIRLVRGDLREDDVGDDLLAGADDGGGGFVAGAFNAENIGVRHGQ